MQHAGSATEHRGAFLARGCADAIEQISERSAGSMTVQRVAHTPTSTGILLAATSQRRIRVMSLVRLLGFRTLACGCVIGRYRELATSRELTYIEEKGPACEMYGHRRNHTIASDRVTLTPEPLSAIRAS